MKLRVEFLKGENRDSEWKGAFWFQPERENFQIYSVIRIASEANVNLEIIAKTFWNDLQDSFIDLSKKHADMALRLEDAVWKMKAKTEALLSRDSVIMEKGIDMEMGITVFSDNVAYCAVIGESKILIYRTERLSDISQALIDSNLTGFVKFGSFKLDPEDRILLVISKNLSLNLDDLTSAARELNINLLNNSVAKNLDCVLFLGSEILDWYQEIAQTSDIEKITPTEAIPSPDNSTEFPEESSFDNRTEKENIEPDFADFEDSFSEEKPKRADGIFSGIKSRFKFSKRADSSLTVGKNAMYKELNLDDKVLLEEEEFPDLEQKKKRIVKINLNAAKLAINRAATFLFSIPSRISNYLKNNKSTYLHIIKKFFNGIKKLLNFFWRLFQREIIGTSDRRDFFIKSKRRSRNRKILAIVLAITVVFLFFSFRDAENKRIEQEYKDKVLTTIKQLETSQTEILNQSELEASKAEPLKTELTSKLDKLTLDAQKEIKRITEVSENEKKYATYIANLNKIIQKNQEITDKLNNVFTVNNSNIKIIADLEKLFPGSNVTDIEFSGGNIYAADAGNNAVYKIPINSGEETRMIVQNLESPSLLAKSVDGDIIVYDNSNSGAIGKIYTKESDRFERFATLPYSSIGNVKAVDIYSGNDALYELRTFPNPYIFKREREGAGYAGGGANYITINPPNWREDADFSNGVDIAAPYELYVLIEGKGIKRYLSGGENTLTPDLYKNFSAEDVSSLSKAKAIDARGSYMAVSDSENKRVLLFYIESNESKSLLFIGQYLYRGEEEVLENQKEILINELSVNTLEIYVLDQNRVIGLNFQN